MLSLHFFAFLFFVKQKTAYEMRISDWSSDVCSSDLPPLFSGCELGARTRPRTGTQKRETSPPVVADERLAVGRAAASASIFFSAAVSAPAGTSISPEAIAASRWPAV